MNSKGRPVGQSDDLHTLALEDLVEGGAELGVAITEQEPGTQLSVLQLPGQVLRLLDDSGPARAVGAAGEVDATAADLDPEQNVELGQPDGIHHEEVNRQDLIWTIHIFERHTSP